MTIFEQLIKELSKLLAHVRQLLGDPATEPLRILYFLRELGWEIPTTDAMIANLSQASSLSILGKINDIVTILEKDKLEPKDYTDLVSLIKDTFDAAKTIGTDLKDKVLSDLDEKLKKDFADYFSRQFLDYLVISYLKTEHEKVYNFLSLLGIIEENYEHSAGDSIRKEYFKREICWDRFATILDGPGDLIGTVYGWGQRDFKYRKVLDTIQYLMDSLGVMAVQFQGVSSDAIQDLSDAGESLVLTLVDTWDLKIGLEIYPTIPVDPASNDAGLAISPFVEGGTDKNIPIDDYLSLELEKPEGFNLDRTMGFALRPSGISTFTTGIPVKEGDLAARVHIKSPEGKLFGEGLTGSRIEIGEITAALVATVKPTDCDMGVELGVKEGSLIIAAGEGDGFIQTILPKEPLIINFAITLGVSKGKGFYVKGAAGLEYTFQVNKEIGPILIKNVNLKLNTDDDIALITGVSGTAKIGCVSLTVDNIGLETKLEIGKPGLFGDVDLSLEFKPPSGIALSVDCQGVKGGGSIYAADGNYSGIFNLEVYDTVSVQVIAILITKMPDGSSIFSLKIFGSLVFTGIQIGFGFVLSGVGLAVALQCDMDVEAIRGALFDGRLNSLLFPPDPVANAQQIITDLNSFFPAKKNNYVFGIMCRIGWGGVADLIKADVGLFVSVGSATRIVLAGIAHAELPTEDLQILKLQFSVLGTYDSVGKTLAIDGSLSGSELLRFPLDGDIALRVSWGDSPRFALSAGGFYPGYPVPQGFPNLKRMSITISSGNPRIGLFSYFALTENSVQFGAELLFHWQKKFFWPVCLIELDGNMSFDALFKFNPFYFEVKVGAELSLKRKGKVLMSIALRLTLSGPNNYRAIGYAKLKILGFSVKIEFDKTFGEKKPEISPEPISPLQALRDELDIARNWTVVPPAEVLSLVSYRNDDELKDILDPFGGVRFSQKVLPLQFQLQKFGRAPIPVEEDYFDITSDSLKSEEAREFFAPGEFTYLSEEQKVSSTFEKFKSGIQISGDTVCFLKDKIQNKKMEYETKEYRVESPLKFKFVVNPRVLYDTQFLVGKRVHNRLNKKSTLRQKPGIIVKEPRFTVVTSEVDGDKFKRAAYEKGGQEVEVGDLNYAQASQMNKSKQLAGTEVVDVAMATAGVADG